MSLRVRTSDSVPDETKSPPGTPGGDFVLRVSMYLAMQAVLESYVHTNAHVADGEGRAGDIVFTELVVQVDARGQAVGRADGVHLAEVGTLAISKRGTLGLVVAEV